MNIDTAIILLDNLARHDHDTTGLEREALGMGVKALRKMKEVEVTQTFRKDGSTGDKEIVHYVG